MNCVVIVVTANGAHYSSDSLLFISGDENLPLPTSTFFETGAEALHLNVLLEEPSNFWRTSEWAYLKCGTIFLFVNNN